MKNSVKCPVCREVLPAKASEEESSIHPFCSVSCRDRDLGGWLQDQYRLGSRPLESDDMDGLSDGTDD